MEAQPAAERRRAALAIAILGAFHLALGQSTADLRLDIARDDPARSLALAGAVDERRYYLPDLGAFAGGGGFRMEPVVRTGAVASQDMKVLLQLGMDGFRQPLEQPVGDIFALSDPLVARLQPLPYGRPGHRVRPLPADFWRWREPAHRFADAHLDALAPALRLAHLERDLWSAERLRAVASLLLQPSVPTGGLSVRREEDAVRLEVEPARLYRRWALDGAHGPPDRLVVALRVYDRVIRRAERHVVPAQPYPRALDRECREVLDARHAIDVAAGERLVLTCAKSLVHRDGIVLATGARQGEAILWDEAIVAVQPPFSWWTRAVPGWLTEGWRARPWPPLVVGTLLVLVAFMLGRRGRGV